jgi:hypothetical protein
VETGVVPLSEGADQHTDLSSAGQRHRCPDVAGDAGYIRGAEPSRTPGASALGKMGRDEHPQALSAAVVEWQAGLEATPGDPSGIRRCPAGGGKSPRRDPCVGGAAAADCRISSCDSDAAARVEQASAANVVVDAVDAGVEADGAVVGDAKPAAVDYIEVQGHGLGLLGSSG